MGVEDHLLALARIGPHARHPAVAEPHVRHLGDGRHAVDDHDLVAPVELIGLARREAQRHERHRRRCALPAPPPGRVAAQHRSRRRSRARAAPRTAASASAARGSAAPRSLPAACPGHPAMAPGGQYSTPIHTGGQRQVRSEAFWLRVTASGLGIAPARLIRSQLIKFERPATDHVPEHPATRSTSALVGSFRMPLCGTARENSELLAVGDA
jgi:hypothetical protein